MHLSIHTHTHTHTHTRSPRPPGKAKRDNLKQLFRWGTDRAARQPARDLYAGPVLPAAAHVHHAGCVLRSTHWGTTGDFKDSQGKL